MSFLSDLIQSFSPKINLDLEVDSSDLRAEVDSLDPYDTSVVDNQLLQTKYQNRIAEYKAYDKCENDHPEIARALDIYADYTVSGSAVDLQGQVYRVKTADGSLNDELNEINDQTGLPTKSWDIVRKMVKYGDQFTQSIYGDPITGRPLRRVIERPVYDIWRHEDDTGRLRVPAYYSIPDNQERPSEGFRRWEMSHFRLGNSMSPGYGVSILKSLVPLCNEIALEESALTLARLTKAHRRLVHKIDVGTAQGVAAQKILRSAQARYKKKRFVSKDGRVILSPLILTEQEDIFAAVSSKQKLTTIDQLAGDSSIDKIKDIEHKFDRLFAGLRASKAWFGLTGPNIRSVVTEQTLSFMRAVRRMRKDYERASNNIYDYGLLSYGVSLDKIKETKYIYIWPAMSHQDDEMLLRLMLLRIEVAGLMMFHGWMDPEDVMLKYMGFDPEEVAYLLPKGQAFHKQALADGDENITKRNGQRTTSASPKFEDFNMIYDQLDLMVEMDPKFADSINEIKLLLHDKINGRSPVKRDFKSLLLGAQEMAYHTGNNKILL